MHSKYNRHVDIFMESHKKALKFGRKEAKVQVITPDDEHLKIETRNKEKHKTKNKKEQQTKQIKQNLKSQSTVSNKPHKLRAAAVLKPQAKP